ncbi:alpha/beta hydrolase [Puia sp.]|jgi:pimeloyl-ACP methyl ester carboxylesterase|uniref:alpha/beta fold hydrolase n=1 Tax=Puia sp. TaxID=2045100 RepID=UPI002F400A1C
MQTTISPAKDRVNNIVLVHGAFADGSGWQRVYTILKARGYRVSVVGNPNTSVEEDVLATQRVLDRQDGPCILVGHSYGGAIITTAGNSAKVAGLVYVAAFAPDKGETLGALLASYPHDPLSGIGEPVDGFVWYDLEKFHAGFAGDLSREESEFMSDSQVPVAASAFGHVFGEPAWRSKPTWYIAASQDHSIPPALERFFGKRTGGTFSEIDGSHLIFISHPEEVATVIEAAAVNALIPARN